MSDTPLAFEGAVFFVSLVWIGFATEGTEFTEMVFEAARRTGTTTRIPLCTL